MKRGGGAARRGGMGRGGGGSASAPSASGSASASASAPSASASASSSSAYSLLERNMLGLSIARQALLKEILTRIELDELAARNGMEIKNYPFKPRNRTADKDDDEEEDFSNRPVDWGSSAATGGNQSAALTDTERNETDKGMQQYALQYLQQAETEGALARAAAKVNRLGDFELPSRSFSAEDNETFKKLANEIKEMQKNLDNDNLSNENKAIPAYTPDFDDLINQGNAFISHIIPTWVYLRYERYLLYSNPDYHWAMAVANEFSSIRELLKKIVDDHLTSLEASVIFHFKQEGTWLIKRVSDWDAKRIFTENHVEIMNIAIRNVLPMRTAMLKEDMQEYGIRDGEFREFLFGFKQRAIDYILIVYDIFDQYVTPNEVNVDRERLNLAYTRCKMIRVTPPEELTLAHFERLTKEIIYTQAILFGAEQVMFTLYNGRYPPGQTRVCLKCTKIVGNDSRRTRSLTRSGAINSMKYKEKV